MSAKKYIDRDAALFELKTGFFPQSMEFTEAVSIAKGIIERAPGVDAVEVVRCKDCKYCITLKDGGSQCERIDGLLMTKPNDYCSYGKRSEKNGNSQKDSFE